MADLQLGALAAAAAAGSTRPVTPKAQPAPAPAPPRAQASAPAPVVEVPEPPTPDLAAAQKAIEGAVEQIRQYLKDTPVGFEYSRDGATGRMLLRIVDRDTQELIRQVPSEEILAIARALDRFKGLLTPQKV